MTFVADRLDVENSMWALSEIQESILRVIRQHGRATTPLIRETLKLPDRTTRYHLGVLSRHGLVAPHGAKRGRYYTEGSGAVASADGPESRSAAVLADILDAGGSIRERELRRLVKRHGYDSRVIGSLHGRRLAHLRRDRKTGTSVLTARGREVAEQYVFAMRLSRGSKVT